MGKLFPPLIEGAIPAFYNDNGTVLLTVPFSMNRAVSPAEVGGLVLKIKTVQSSTYLFSKTVENINDYEIEDSPYVDFYLTAAEAEKLREGQSYKCQLAYLDKKTKEVGHYSTVGLVKYTTKPNITIDGLDPYIINMHSYEYMGFYNQYEKDVTERVYSYRFDLYGPEGELVTTSGDQLHDSSQDIAIYESYDKYMLSQDLEIDKSFYIQYTVTTTGGMVISSPRYRIMQKLSIDPEIKATLAADMNFDNGYVNIRLVGIKDDDGVEEPATGAFLLTRSCEDTDFSVWDEISRFKLAAQKPSRWLWRDFTTEQGKRYKYALQQYNDKGLYSNKIISNEIYMDFEDAFLFDGIRQLKIKYNPKVTSFKADVLETKMDTIGGKHPFIFRNGRVYYREFPISGLISYLMDEENLFFTDDRDESTERSITPEVVEDFIASKRSTALSGENIAAEREFKLEVLKWLTNGETKLFRSPSEGNYIVRLLNTSLTPNDTVGRMLHTFQCTAYEVADFSYENLNKFNFIHLEDPEVATLRWETVPFVESVDGKLVYKTGKMNRYKAYTVRISDLTPGDFIYIITDPKFNFESATEAARNEFKVVIGVTGSYFIDSKVPIEQIIIPEGVRYTGSMTYSYYSILQNKFNKIDNVMVHEVPTQQFIGAHDIIKEIEYVPYGEGWAKNPKVDILEFYVIHASKRTVEKALYSEHDNTYRSHNNEVLVPDVFTLYAIGDYQTTGPGYRPGYPNQEYVLSHYRDPANDDIRIEKENYDPALYINGSQVSIYETERYTMERPGKLASLSLGNGVMAEVAYQIRTIEYSIENDETWGVLPYKQAYEQAVEELNTYLTSGDLSYNAENSLRQKVHDSYIKYIQVLIEKQEEEKVADGLL